MAAPSEHVVGKSQRKQNKKILRIKGQLAKKENVIVCEYPTTILCVQNGGLDNGVSQGDLHDLFMQYGHVQDIIMVPRKSFCFVCYDTNHSAATAQEQLTGYLLREGKDPSQNITLYVFFVANAPSNVCASKELPPGLLLLEDFITRESEQLLMDTINFESQGAAGPGSSLKHREVKHFGYEFQYGINNVDPSEPLAEGIPEQCHELLHRAVDMNVVSHFPDQLTVNRYLPGQGIPPHVDTPSAFEDGIMSLSCGSQVIMDFRHPDGRHLSVLVPPRSLLIMTGESRYIWSHGITPRKSDIVPSTAGGVTLATRGVRLSFTFRKLSATAGVIPTDQTDSTLSVPQTEEEAVALEKKHVHQVYEEIADHFSDTRHKPWPQIAQFLMDQVPGSILVDIGCGNGKYFGVNSQLYQIGSDRSENLAGIVQSRGYQVFVGDVLAIPVRSASVDVGLCIAVIHHLSTKARRKQAVEELVRILRPGGCVLIYVWAQEQQKDNQKSTYLKPHRQYKKETTIQKTNVQVAQNVNVQDTEGLFQTGVETPHTVKEFSAQSISCRPTDKTDDDMHDKKLDALCDNETCGQGDSRHFEEMETTNLSDKNVPGDEAHVKEYKKEDHQETDAHLNGQCIQVHVNRTEFKDQNMLVPWQLKIPKNKEQQAGIGYCQRTQQTFHRFYHMFQQGELDALCAEVAGCVIKRSYYDQGNWCVVLKKSDVEAAEVLSSATQTL